MSARWRRRCDQRTTTGTADGRQCDYARYATGHADYHHHRYIDRQDRRGRGARLRPRGAADRGGNGAARPGSSPRTRLLLATRLCDRIDARTDAGGTTITLTVTAAPLARCGAPRARPLPATMVTRSAGRDLGPRRAQRPAHRMANGPASGRRRGAHSKRTIVAARARLPGRKTQDLGRHPTYCGAQPGTFGAAGP